MSVFLYKKSLKINTIPKGERMQNSGLVRRIDELGRIVIPKEYQVGKVECFQGSICVYVECRTENGEYKPIIWNTDIIDEILE